MKKTFKTFALMLLTAFAFSSCVDVPAPFELPKKGSATSEGSSTEQGTAITCAQAVELTNALANDGTSTEIYSITGYITEVIGDVSKNQQRFWIADTKDGGRIFQAYYANLPEGVTAFTVGMKVTITGKLTKFVNKTSGDVTCEIKNPTVVILPDDGGDTPAEQGTEITCAQAVELTNALADKATSTETYTVTGYITSIVGSVSTSKGAPQQSFWMADTKDGGQVFQAYYANVPATVSEFVVGMKVKITGQLKKFVNAQGTIPEMVNPTVVILADEGSVTPAEQAITCAQAVELTNALADRATSTETYTVTGYITSIVGSVSTSKGAPQQSFWMADTKDGGQVFQAYYANVPATVSEFVVGMKVKITGQLKKYVNAQGTIPEMGNPDVVILENADGSSTTPGTTPGDDDPNNDDPNDDNQGDKLTELINGSLESWVNDSAPEGWTNSNTVHNAQIEKSSAGRSGFGCLIKANAGTNMRFATQEIILQPGTYTFSFYAKPASAASAQTRAGYVAVDKELPYSYNYGEYVNLSSDTWTLVSYDFTLESQATVCLICMNPKSNANKQYEAQDIIVDDVVLTQK